jgi:hypothetical protein
VKTVKANTIPLSIREKARNDFELIDSSDGCKSHAYEEDGWSIDCQQNCRNTDSNMYSYQKHSFLMHKTNELQLTVLYQTSDKLYIFILSNGITDQ